MKLEEIKKIWAAYEKTTPKTSEYKQHILNIVKNNPSKSWSFVFEYDKAMASEMYLLQVEYEAKNAKERYINTPSHEKSKVLKEVVLEAYKICKKNNEVKEIINKQFLYIWETVFADIPEFKPQVKETFDINKSMYENMLREYGIKF